MAFLPFDSAHGMRRHAPLEQTIPHSRSHASALSGTDESGGLVARIAHPMPFERSAGRDEIIPVRAKVFDRLTASAASAPRPRGGRCPGRKDGPYGVFP